MLQGAARSLRSLHYGVSGYILLSRESPCTNNYDIEVRRGLYRAGTKMEVNVCIISVLTGHPACYKPPILLAFHRRTLANGR